MIKGSVHRKLLTIFVVLSTIATSIGLVVIDGTRRTAKLNQKMALISAFHLHVKDLQLLRSRMQESEKNTSKEDLAKQFTESQALAKAIEIQGTRLDSRHGQMYAKLTSQLESFREAYLELVKLHNDRLKNEQIHHELLEMINLRLAYLSDDIKSQVKPKLASFSLLYAKIHYEQDNKYLVPMQSLHKTIVALIPDAMMIETMNRTMELSDFDVQNKEAINDLVQVLGQMSASFTKATEAATQEISNDIVQVHARLKAIVLALVSVMLGALALSFLLSKRYLNTFIQGLNQSMQAIRAGRFDYKTPSSPQDELGEQVFFIKEVATTLKQNLTALTDSEQRFRNLVENISDWIWVIDQHGTCTYSSPLVKNIIGLEVHTIIGRSLLEVLTSGGGKLANPAFEVAWAKQEPFANLLHKLHPVHTGDDRTVFLETSGRPLADSTGQFQGFTLISKDVSDRLQVEVELARASRANFFLNQILELALLDVDLPTIMGRFLGLMAGCSWINTQPKAVFFMIDKSSNSLVMTAHRGIDSYVQKSCRVLPLGTCLCGRAAQTGKVIFASSDDNRHEMSYHGMAAHCHYCLPVHTVAGEIIGVVGLYLNPGSQWDGQDETVLVSATTIIGSIIRRRQAEDSLRDLNQNLERQIESRTAQLTATNQELDSFAYTVSHDLRAPLRAIDGFSLALDEDFGPRLAPEARGYLARIRSGCERMSALIDGILRLSRLTRTELDWQPIDLSKIADEIIEEIRAEAPQRVVEYCVAADLTATADPAMLRIVLTNLLGNAWKYSANTAKARIEFGALRHEGSEATFFVKDNGAGFDMRYSDKLFKAFQRLHSAKEFAGNGIGLATVQRILHRHGGKVWAESQVGVGATFYFTLGNQDAIE